MADGYALLGESLGGDSEKAYQEGLHLGAKTNEAMANARKRVDENMAREVLKNTLEAAGLPSTVADASATALRAGGGLGDVIGILGKQQEQGFRAIAGSADPTVDAGARNRALFGIANAPVEPFRAVGSHGYQDILDPSKGVLPLGDAVAGGGDATPIQVLRAYGLLDEQGRVRPGSEALAFDVMRTTQQGFDVGGQPFVRSANPFRAGGPSSLADAVAPPARPVAATAAPAAPAAAPATTPAPATAPLAPMSAVTSNTAQVERAKEIGTGAGKAAVNLPKSEAMFRNQTAQADLVMDNIDKAVGDTSVWTAGPAAAIIGWIPGTPAFDLLARINVIKANIGFQGLQQMRYESPTGGALGQVAVEELRFLQATLGNLDNAQSPKQLVEMLQKAKGHYEKFKINAAADLEAAKRTASLTPQTAPGAAPAPASAPAAGAPVQVRTPEEAMALPSGTVFITPDGRRKVRP